MLRPKCGLFRLEASPLDVRVAEGTEEAETRIVSIIIPTATTASFSASASGGAWLTVAPANGTAPRKHCGLTESPGLATGTYREASTIRVAGATPAEQSVPVRRLRLNPAGAKIAGRTQIHHPVHDSGWRAKSRTGQISNEERHIYVRAAVSEAPWLSAEPDSGTVTATAPIAIVVKGDPRGMEPGSYSGRVVVSSSTAEEAAIEVVMTVTAAQQSILLSQTGLTYTAVAQGGSVPPQNFGVLNISSGVMNWSAAASTLSGGFGSPSRARWEQPSPIWLTFR